MAPQAAGVRRQQRSGQQVGRDLRVGVDAGTPAPWRPRPPPRTAPRPGRARTAPAGSPGSARASTGSARHPSTRCGATCPGRGGSRPGRRRSAATSSPRSSAGLGQHRPGQRRRRADGGPPARPTHRRPARRPPDRRAGGRAADRADSDGLMRPILPSRHGATCPPDRTPCRPLRDCTSRRSGSTELRRHRRVHLPVLLAGAARPGWPAPAARPAAGRADASQRAFSAR